MYKIVKLLLFLLPAETAHHLTMGLFKRITYIPFFKRLLKLQFVVDDSHLTTTVFGLKFSNPVGLAAGFDKNGSYIEAMSLLGFGFIEVGTVTPKPQIGNPRPRLFRIPKDQGLINRMGFNNKGVDHLVDNLKKYDRGGLIIGGNIGKNKVTPNDEAWKDYLLCFQKLYDYVDYFVVNLSSPNTPGLRELQDKKPLRKILSALKSEREKRDVRKPLLLKIAPDISGDQIDDILSILEDLQIDGVIATNTTVSRMGLNTAKDKIESLGNGGLSGLPLRHKSTEVIRAIRNKSTIPIIGVGGINSAESALEKLDSGSSLIQVYSGLVYEGPLLIRQINKALLGHSSK